MPKFTTRVELHNANGDDYDNLHDEMKAEGFTRTIKNSDGESYRLPTAEYNYIGNNTASEVRDKAADAAGRVKKKFAVLVTESASRSWQGLDKV